MQNRTFSPAFALSLPALAGLASVATPSGASADMLQLCAQQPAGFVVAIQQGQGCDQIPGSWVTVASDDGDWTGAGTGAMRTGHPDDRVAVGDADPEARLHVAYGAQDPAAFLVDETGSGVEALRVDSVGRTVLGGASGTSARLTVNAPEGEEAIRVRAGGITSFVVASDGQVGVGTSTPGAALQVNAQGDEDPLHLRAPGTAQPGLVFDASGNLGIGDTAPGDRLSVLNDDLGRAGFFRTENPLNIAAALSATTTGRGSAMFANVLNGESTSSAVHAIHSGGGRAGQFEGDLTVSGDVGIGTLSPTTTLHIQGDDDGTDILVRDDRFARLQFVADDPEQDVRLTVQSRGDATVQRAEIGTVSDHGMVLFTDGRTRIRLGADGTVCIGNC